jgi:PST family polysaccharide transporter
MSDAGHTPPSGTDASVAVVKNLGWLMIGPIFRLLVAIPLAGFTAHQLGLEGYGEFNLALSLVAMFGVVANLGLNEVLTRSVAQRPGDAPVLWSSVLAFKAGPLSVYVGVLFGAAWCLGYSERMVWIVLLLGVAQWLISLENTTRSIFAGYQRMKVLGRFDVVKAIVETVVSFTILYLGYGVVHLAGVRLSMAVFGFCVTAVLLARQWRFRFAWPRWGLMLGLLPSGFRFAQASMLVSLYERSGFVLLAHLAGPAAVGLVSTASTLTEKIFWFAPIVQGVIFPFFSRLQVVERDRFRSAFARALRYQVLIAVGCGLSVSLLGPWLIRFVFPQEFHTAGLVVEVLGWTCAPKLISSLFVTVLQSLSQERRVSWVCAAQCLFYLGVTFVSVSWWGVMGFAWAYLAAEMLGVGLYALLLRRVDAFAEAETRSLVAITICGIALFFVTGLLPGGRDNWLGVMGVLLCFPALLVISRGVSRDDMRYLHGLWLNKRPSLA